MVTPGRNDSCRFVALFSCQFSLASFSCSRSAQQPAYLDTHLSPQERAHDLVGRMTLEEKVNQLEDWAHGDSASRHSGLSDMERGSAWRGARRIRHGISAGHRHGRNVGPFARAKHGQRHLPGGAREVQPGAARGQSPHLLWPDVLVAEHQHLSRSPLGPRTRDIRRRSVPDRRLGIAFIQGVQGPT